MDHSATAPDPSATTPDPELHRQSRKLRRPGSWFLTMAIALEVPGVLLFVLGSSWVAAIGLALMALGGPFGMVGIALLLSAAVSGWSAHRRPFA